MNHLRLSFLLMTFHFLWRKSVICHWNVLICSDRQFTDHCCYHFNDCDSTGKSQTVYSLDLVYLTVDDTVQVHSWTLREHEITISNQRIISQECHKTCLWLNNTTRRVTNSNRDCNIDFFFPVWMDCEQSLKTKIWLNHDYTQQQQ